MADEIISKFGEAEVKWIADFTGKALADKASEADQKKRQALLGDAYVDIDYATADLRDAFTFDVVRDSSNAIKRFFGVKRTMRSISDVNLDGTTTDTEEELDVFYDLKRFIAEDQQFSEDRMDETVERLDMARSIDGGVTIRDDQDQERSADEVLERLKAGMAKVKAVVARMESAVDENGERLFSDADIRDEVFMPMVREGIFPESMIPDRFSDVAQTFKGASEAYMERLTQYSIENPNGDRNRKIKFAATICKQTADVALSNVKLVAACGGPAEAIKYAEFAKLAVSFTADATVQLFEKSDADSVIDAFKNAVVGGIKTFGNDATATLVGGILTGAIGVARGARAAIVTGDPAAALNEIADAAVGICAAVASQKSEEEAKAINEIAGIVQKCVKAASATVVAPVTTLAKGGSTKEAAKAALISAFSVAATEITQQACAKVHERYIKAGVKDAGDKARKEGKTDEEIKEAEDGAQEDGEGSRDDAVDGLGDDVPAFVGDGLSLIEGLAGDVNGAVSANERHTALADVLNQKELNAAKAIDDLKAGLMTPEAIEMARVMKNEEAVAPSDRLKAAQGKVHSVLSGPEIAGKSPRDWATLFLGKRKIDDLDAALEDLTAGTETPGSLALADFVTGTALVEASKTEVDTFLGSGDPEATKKAMEQLQGVMEQVQVKAAQEALLADARSFRETMLQGFDLPTNPEELAEQEAQRQLARIEPLIRQIKQDQQLMELASKVVNGGAAILEKFFPPAAIATAGIAMVEELYKAYQRQQEFLLWMDNTLDAKSAVSVHIEGFLNRMNLSNRQRIDHMMMASLKCIQMIGAILETAGTAHPAVLAAGKIVSASAATTEKTYELIKTIETEEQMRRAWNTYQAALGNPKSRKLARRALRKNPTLAKYAIAYGATVANDPVARLAMNRCGLSDKVLANEGTNVDKVVEFLETLYPEDPILERNVPTETWFPVPMTAQARAWVAFVQAAQTKAEPKMVQGDYKPITALFVALEKAEAHYTKVPATDPEEVRWAVERILSRTGEIREALERFDPRDDKKRPHDTMRNAAIGFIQAVAVVESRYKGALEGLPEPQPEDEDMVA